MRDEVLAFFVKMPGALPLYEAFEQRMLGTFPEIEIDVKKTQISFRARYVVAAAWLPFRKMKGRPDVYLIVSILLDHAMDDPRVFDKVETRANRWTNHVMITDASQIDDQLMNWITEAYQFGLRK